MSRWTIKKNTSLFAFDKWNVRGPNVPSPHILFNGEIFDTHAEAIAYADRMARTIKVTYITASVEDNMLVCATPLFNYRTRQHATLETLALALLANYHTQEHP